MPKEKFCFEDLSDTAQLNAIKQISDSGVFLLYCRLVAEKDIVDCKIREVLPAYDAIIDSVVQKEEDSVFTPNGDYVFKHLLFFGNDFGYNFIWDLLDEEEPEDDFVHRFSVLIKDNKVVECDVSFEEYYLTKKKRAIAEKEFEERLRKTVQSLIDDICETVKWWFQRDSENFYLYRKFINDAKLMFSSKGDVFII